MRRFVSAAAPVLALSLAGCGGSNPPAEVPALSEAQVAAEDQQHQDAMAAEKVHDKELPKAVYVPYEEAVVNDAEREHEAALREAKRSETPPAKKR